MDSTFTDAERDAWQQRYAAAQAILEYGAGETTRFACRTGRAIRTQESDPRWVAALSAEPEIAAAIASGKAALVHADIGPVENWGYPDDLDSEFGWRDYVLAPWHGGATFDLVMVDGRFRVASILAAVLFAQPGTLVLVHDFWPRPHYHCVLPFLDWQASVDTLAVFATRAAPDRSAAERLLESHLHDPE